MRFSCQAVAVLSSVLAPTRDPLFWLTRSILFVKLDSCSEKRENGTKNSIQRNDVQGDIIV